MSVYDDLPPAIRVQVDDLAEDLARTMAVPLEAARDRLAEALRVDGAAIRAGIKAGIEAMVERIRLERLWPSYAMGGDGLLADALAGEFRHELDRVAGVCPHAVRFLGDSCPICDGRP